MSVPSVLADEMREGDRIMTEEPGVGLLQMMELAGRNLAEVARRLLGGDLARHSIVGLAGAGNNSRGGAAGARRPPPPASTRRSAGCPCRRPGPARGANATRWPGSRTATS